MDINPENLKCLPYRRIQVISENVEINAAETEIHIKFDERKTTLIAENSWLSPVCDVPNQKGLLI